MIKGMIMLCFAWQAIAFAGVYKCFWNRNPENIRATIKGDTNHLQSSTYKRWYGAYMSCFPAEKMQKKVAESFNLLFENRRNLALVDEQITLLERLLGVN